MNGTIFFTLEGASQLQVERCRDMIERMFREGVFNVRRGEVTLKFNAIGDLTSIHMDVQKWHVNDAKQPFAGQRPENKVSFGIAELGKDGRMSVKP